MVKKISDYGLSKAYEILIFIILILVAYTVIIYLFNKTLIYDNRFEYFKSIPLTIITIISFKNFYSIHFKTRFFYFFSIMLFYNSMSFLSIQVTVYLDKDLNDEYYELEINKKMKEAQIELTNINRELNVADTIKVIEKNILRKLSFEYQVKNLIIAICISALLSVLLGYFLDEKDIFKGLGI